MNHGSKQGSTLLDSTEKAEALFIDRLIEILLRQVEAAETPTASGKEVVGESSQ